MAHDKAVIATTPAPTAGHPTTNMRKDEFEALIENQGYSVYLERAYTCPCRVAEAANAPRSNCRNCGGSGYVFVNKYLTKMILRSMNMNTQFKEWSQEMIGTVSLTARDSDKVGFMDRITAVDGRSFHNQVLSIQRMSTESADINFVTVAYDIIEVDNIFVFDSSDTPLRRLHPDVDYTFEENRIIFLTEQVEKVVTIKFTHRPQFHVLDLVRETMVVSVKDASGKKTSVLMPVSGVGRRSHYVLDANTIDNTYMFDNSYTEEC